MGSGAVTKVKLTVPQLELLRESAHLTGAYAVEGYRPREKLIQLGLIEVTEGKFGESRLRITPAGRAVLADMDAGGRE